MRPSPRTWPSILLSRLRQGALISLRMADIYPSGVCGSSGATKRQAMPHPIQAEERARGGHDHAPHGQAPPRPPASATATDPVCGMRVDPHATAHRHEHHGRTYYFCSEACRSKFAENPAKYLKPEGREGAAIPPGTIYTCPMHPQIRQPGPGTCPICGMALEPALPTTGPNPELADMTRRFWIGLVLAIPVVALEMGGHLTDLHMLLSQNLSNWLQFIIATPVVLWAGWPFFVRGWRSVIARSLN